MSKEARRLYEFGHFRIDTVDRLLLRDGKPILLKPKVVDTLLLLIESRGRVLEKDELISKLWPDSFVEEGNLTQNIYVLRKTFESEEGAESYIQTIPRRGYRFAVEVKEIPYEVSETHTSVPAIEILASNPNGEGGAQESIPENLQDPFIAPAISPSRGKRTRLWIFISSVFLLALVVLVFAYRFVKQTKPAEHSEIKSLAILPFKSLNAEAADEYMGEGMADALITKMSNSRQIAVRPTSAVLRYGSNGSDPLIAGRELGVEAVLDGKIQLSGGRLRVTVQLLRVVDGASLWAEKFDEKFTDIFSVQDSISYQAAHSLTVQLTGSERELMRKQSTQNTEAYQAYLQGRYFWNKRNAAGFKKGIDYFQQAIKIDPNYAPAYAGLADCYIRLNEYGVPMAQESVPKGRSAVLKALELDESLAEAHATLAFIKFRHDWDFSGAEEEFKRSLNLDANYSEAHQWYAFYLLAMGRTQEADEEMKRAQELDPLSIGFNSSFALYLFFTRQFDQSVQQARKTVDMEPSLVVPHLTLAMSYEQKGLNEAAITELQQALELLPDDDGTTSALGHAFASGGKVKDARDVLRNQEERAKKSYVPPYGIAILYAGLGEKKQALEWLERAFQDRSLRPVWLKFDPRLDSLRNDGELVDLIRRVGLAP